MRTEPESMKCPLHRGSQSINLTERHHSTENQSVKHKSIQKTTIALEKVLWKIQMEDASEQAVQAHSDAYSQ